MVSVIISTFNRKKKLKRAINSVLEQTFQDFEIIVVDDASTDGTDKMCKKLIKKEPQVRYMRRDSNWGKHGKVKNEGIKAAKGEYITFLDDDNEYLMDHLQALHNNITRTGVDVVYGDRWVVDESGKHDKRKGPHGDFDYNRLIVQNYIDTSDVMCKKQSLLDVGGWDEDLNKFADWNLWVRMFKAGKTFQHVPLILTNYYFHAGMNQLQHESPIDPQTGRLLPTFEPSDCKIIANQTTFDMPSELKVAVFTMTYDRLEYTQKTFESFADNANYPYDHFVIDQNSQDGTREWLKENKKRLNIKKIVLNPQNTGISKGSNQALEAIKKAGDYDVIIKLDNDCLIESKEFLSTMMFIFERNRMFVLSPNIEGLIDSAGGVPRYRDGYVGNYLLGFVNHLGGICVAAPKEAYENFRWKEDDFLHGMQDSIFSRYCVESGFVMAYVENIRAMHIDSTTGQKAKFKDYFERRKEEKITKYKG